jgi:deazaflavin-dependent oxidoreductase (nitroreductase family)
MTGWDRTAFEDQMIADLRAHDGVASQGPLAGQSLLIMTSTGAKSGLERRAILTWSRDDGDYVVAGTAGGSSTEPAWVENVRRHPEVMVEAEGRVTAATGRVIEAGPERDRLWAQHVALLPNFAEYPKKTGRVIPVVRLTPV